MKILVKGDIYPSIDTLDELGISYESTEEGIAVNFSDDMRIGQNNAKFQNSDYVSTYCPLLSEYIESGDESLSSFIYTAGGLGMITASGKIEKVPKTEEEELAGKEDEYVCSSAMRFFERNRYSTIGFTTSAENAMENFVDYAESMLSNSLPVSKSL